MITDTVTVERDLVHPWSGTPGWDRLTLRALSIDRLSALIRSAESKLWKIFIRDNTMVSAIMFKPHGVEDAWTTKFPPSGSDNELAVGLQVGDAVYTDFNGHNAISRHAVVERMEKASCGSGVLLRVKPPVRGSGSSSADTGGTGKASTNPWLDAAWFRKLK